jgi:hypothetical protein
MIQSKIDELQSILETETNEKVLIERGQSLLIELRQAWPKHKNDFSDNDISKLRSFTVTLEAVNDFIDLQEEFEYVRSVEDSNNLVNDLFLLSEHLHDFPLKGRLLKEIRELNEKSVKLPNDHDRKESAKLSHAIATLSSRSPICKKCGSNMVLREGNGSFFWGCEHFPGCWGKSWLSKEELDIINK